MAEERHVPRVDSLDALLDVVVRVVDDARSRGATITARASTLAGFSGTILAIIAALGRELPRLDVGTVGQPVTQSLFLVSIVALAAAATLALGGALRTQSRILVSAD